MTGDSPGRLRATYSTISAASVAEIVGRRYAIGVPLECCLLNRGFNDIFGFRTSDGRRYVVRLSSRRRRNIAEVTAETAFLAHLDLAGVAVAAAVPTRGGSLFTEVVAPEGRRAMVVFRHAEGRPPHLDAPEDARAHGVTLARIHTAAEAFPGGKAGRGRLDLDHLLHRQVAAVLKLDALTPATRDTLTGLESRLSAWVGALDGLTWTRCHGDCHGQNARIATAGPLAGTAVFFDFDDGGFGYLAYDLAVFLWAQVSFQRQRYPMWHAFIEGYRSVRPIRRTDFEAVHLFVPIRHIWLMGEFAGQVTEWGTENLSAAWLDRQAEFLRLWAAERLSASLFCANANSSAKR